MTVQPSLSVVVPIYDEEDVIGECLGRLTAQLEYISEIVVVDNNSTDGGPRIVKEMMADVPEIRLVRESTQGLVHARNAGLDAATGDLLARIDADTRVASDWARTVVEFFAEDSAQAWAAACGRGEAYDVPLEGRFDRWKIRLHPFGQRRLHPEVKEVPVLYGSNMMLRRTTWEQIRPRASMRRNVFEDVDLGLCVQDAGGRIAFLAALTVGVSPRRMLTGPVAFARYMSFLPRTFLLHRRFALAAGAAFVYVPAITLMHTSRLLLLRAYDLESGRFSPRNLLRPNVDRVLP